MSTAKQPAGQRRKAQERFRGANGVPGHTSTQNGSCERTGPLLALDISSTAIGVIALDGADLACRRTIPLPGKRLQTRVYAAYHAIRLLLDEVQPGTVAYEGPAYHTQPLALIAQQNVIGVLLVLCEARGLTAVPVPPTVAKKALASKGNASKPQMIAAASARYPSAFGYSEHEADALGVALARINESENA